MYVQHKIAGNIFLHLFMYICVHIFNASKNKKLNNKKKKKNLYTDALCVSFFFLQ